MTWFSIIAVYFVVWWMVLLAVLPFGMKTQDEAGDVTLGTVPSAPRGPHMLRAMAITTVVSLVVVAGFFTLTRYFGFSVDDIPRIVPDFD